MLETNTFITDNQKFGIEENLDFDPEYGGSMLAPLKCW
jgi:hypothetical protein